MVDSSSRLRKICLQRKISQKRLADEIGCSEAAINKILKGHTKRSRLLPSIAAVLGVSVEWLMGNAPVGNSAEPVLSLLPDESALRRLFFQMLNDIPGSKRTSVYSAAMARHFPLALASLKDVEPEQVSDRPKEIPVADSLSSHPTSAERVEDRLAKAMSAQGISQKKLAKAVGCSQVTISKILSGHIHRSRILPDLASALGVSSAWLDGTAKSTSETRLAQVRLLLPSPSRLELIFYNILMQAADFSTSNHLARLLAREFPLSIAALELDPQQSTLTPSVDQSV